MRRIIFLSFFVIILYYFLILQHILKQIKKCSRTNSYISRNKIAQQTVYQRLPPPPRNARIVSCLAFPAAKVQRSIMSILQLF